VNEHPTKTPWHLLLGRLLSLTLEPVRVQVLVEVPLLTDAPKADIVLLRREGEQWSAEQRRWLADGLRHADEGHLLIEFKRSEGLNLKALQQLNAYDYFYLEGNNLMPDKVACFLVVASTPMGDWQSRLGFSATEWPGVYRGSAPLLERVRVLLLNELDPTAHNAPLKCFASRRNEQQKAFVALRDSGFMRLSQIIEHFVNGLWRLCMLNAPQVNELTPEEVMRMGKEWFDSLLENIPADEVLSHFRTDEVMIHYKPEQRLAGLTEEQIRAYLERLQQSKSSIN
jgi:hypothetical protein